MLAPISKTVRRIVSRSNSRLPSNQKKTIPETAIAGCFVATAAANDGLYRPARPTGNRHIQDRPVLTTTHDRR